MIKHSFILLDRVGCTKEQQIWQQGITDWPTFLNAKTISGISLKTKAYYDRKLCEAQQALREETSSYFKERLPSTEMWRLYGYFKEEAGYLDIETDSVGKITVVGISTGEHTNFFVSGVNLDKDLLERELAKYKLLITFNGAVFDLSKLQKQFSINLSIPHIDLKPLCLNLGLKGGLKEIEHILNLKRPSHLYGNPIDLWKAFHASGDREYLQLLLEYNREDCENLQPIMNYGYTKLKQQTLQNYINTISFQPKI